MLPFRTARAFGIPSPTGNSLDVWTIALDRPAQELAALEAVLDQSERGRAKRLWEGPLRSRFVVAHAATRHILAQYLGIPAADVQFDRLPSGKPCVRGRGLSFSLAQSGGLAVLAVSCAGRVGVDLEVVRTVVDADAIVAQMFSEAEARQYAALPAVERLAAWFSGWTRKQALLKASGDLSDRTLDVFDVDLDPAAAAPRVTCRSGEPWFLRSLSPAPGFAAAIAGDFPIDVVNRLEWIAPAEGGDVAAVGDTLELPVPA